MWIVRLAPSEWSEPSFFSISTRHHKEGPRTEDGINHFDEIQLLLNAIPIKAAERHANSCQNLKCSGTFDALQKYR